jgi:tetrahydromethanopterin S-methyltransferase subunit F
MKQRNIYPRRENPNQRLNALIVAKWSIRQITKDGTVIGVMLFPPTRCFRDVFESMNDKINLLFVDELLDAGLDTAGVEASLVIGAKLFLPTRSSLDKFLWYLINT